MDWDQHFLDQAEWIATRCSKDPSTQVGAVIVKGKNRIVSSGYNGFAKGVMDTEERLNNREQKYKYIVHAELNALLFADRNQLGADCTLYTWPFMPCSTCAGAIIQSGIGRVVAPQNDNPRWVESFSVTRQMFKEAGVMLSER